MAIPIPTAPADSHSPVEVAAPNAELSQRLPVVMTRLVRSLRLAYGSVGISLGQYPVLTSLIDQPAATISELAGRERVRLPSMTALVNQMEAEGLVSKSSDPDDRRRVRISLTPAGATAAHAARTARAEWFSMRLEHLSESEVEAISSAMSALEHLVSVGVQG
jgi:DNA-binding MarR family transcriptional regulator